MTFVEPADYCPSDLAGLSCLVLTVYDGVWSLPADAERLFSWKLLAA